MASIPASLQLFQDAPTDDSYERRQVVEYFPISQLGTGPVEFHIPASGRQFTDLKNSKLQLKIKVVHEDGTPMDVQKDKVAFSNLTLHSLWRQVDVFVQQRIVPCNADQAYPYISYMKTMLEKTRFEQEVHLPSECFFKDNAWYMNSWDWELNKGFGERMVRASSGSVMQMEGPLNIDLAQQDRLLLNGMDIVIKLWPHNDAFVLLSNQDDVTYSIKLLEASLKVCRVTPSSSLLLSLNEELKASPALYPHLQTEMKKYQLHAGDYSFSKEDLFSNRVPTRMVVVMVPSENFNGSLKKNPFSFGHNKTTSIGVTIDDEPVPGKPYKLAYPDMTMSAYSAMTDMYPNCNITYEEFNLGFTFYCFPLRHSKFPTSKPTSVQGSVKLQCQFGEALKENTTLLVYAQFPATMEIDAAHNVTFTEH